MEIILVDPKSIVPTLCVLGSPVCRFEVIYSNEIILSVGPTDKLTQCEAPSWLKEAWDAIWNGEMPEVILGTTKRISDFAQKVYRIVREIPIGETKTYGEVAFLVGKPKGARAVGSILRSNPWPLFIPCHRVIGKSGKLLGYGGAQGIELKGRLLAYEADKSRSLYYPPSV